FRLSGSCEHFGQHRGGFFSARIQNEQTVERFSAGSTILQQNTECWDPVVRRGYQVGQRIGRCLSHRWHRVTQRFHQGGNGGPCDTAKSAERLGGNNSDIRVSIRQATYEFRQEDHVHFSHGCQCASNRGFHFRIFIWVFENSPQCWDCRFSHWSEFGNVMCRHLATELPMVCIGKAAFQPIWEVMFAGELRDLSDEPGRPSFQSLDQERNRLTSHYLECCVGGLPIFLGVIR